MWLEMRKTFLLKAAAQTASVISVYVVFHMQAPYNNYFDYYPTERLFCQDLRSMTMQKKSKTAGSDLALWVYRLKYLSNSAGWGILDISLHSARLVLMKFVRSSSGKTPPAVR